MAQTPVFLNIYDMYWINEYVTNIGCGVFHTGIEVYGSEYSYGGHPMACSGIFKTQPRATEELGDNFKFKQNLYLGTTDFAADDIERLVISMGSEFQGDRYHLISKNCNHFSASLSKVLCGKDIPKWINRLAFMSSCVPFLEYVIPKEWLTPVALQQSLDQQNKDGFRLSRSDSLFDPSRNEMLAAAPHHAADSSKESSSAFSRRSSSASNVTSATTTASNAASTSNGSGGASGFLASSFLSRFASISRANSAKSARNGSATDCAAAPLNSPTSSCSSAPKFDEHYGDAECKVHSGNFESCPSGSNVSVQKNFGLTQNCKEDGLGSVSIVASIPSENSSQTLTALNHENSSSTLEVVFDGSIELAFEALEATSIWDNANRSRSSKK